MPFTRRPLVLRNEDTTLHFPMALIAVLCDRRSFWLLLMGTVIFVSQRVAPNARQLEPQPASQVSTGEAERVVASSKTVRKADDGRGRKKINNKQDDRDIIRFNATVRKYPDTPTWMDRYPFLPAVDDVADENRICFVHVGKTAGSTLACYLGFQYPACGINRLRLLPGHLPQWTTHLMHTHYDTCMRQRNTINWYLFTLRDPVARMQSWFRYEYPYSEHVHDYRYKKPLFLDCKFHSLEALAGPRGLGGKGKTLCSRRAWWAMLGVVGFKNHNLYNFGYYYNRTNVQNPKARIAAIRTEYLEQDWISVEERLLGTSPQNSAFKEGFKRKNKSWHVDQNRAVLSPEALENFCDALCEEIQVYKEILERAENLLPKEKSESLGTLYAQCPKETSSATCPQRDVKLVDLPNDRMYSMYSLAQHP